MSFYFYFLTGVLGGLLGGMGMGGGTVLIPLLTLLFGVDQHVAQLANLLCFLPMACAVLPVHFQNGLVQKSVLVYLVPSAVLTSVVCSYLGASLSSVALQRSFGAFLLILGIARLVRILPQPSKQRKHVRQAR